MEKHGVRQAQDLQGLDADLRNLLEDEDLIRQTITSRSNASAHGVDGLGNAIWKADPDITVKLVKQTLRMMTQSGKFPESMKAAKTIFLYKGGEEGDPRAWRPITMMTTLYRIITAHIARCLQLANRTHHMISPHQKGFMLTPAGAIEHITTVNELISDARRTDKALYMISVMTEHTVRSSSKHLKIKRLNISLCFPLSQPSLSIKSRIIGKPSLYGFVSIECMQPFPKTVPASTIMFTN